MLNDLIPDEMILPTLDLSEDALALRDELATRIVSPNIAPLETTAFLDRMLRTFCQDGTPTGLALSNPTTCPKNKRGQRRQIPADAWQPRKPLSEPIVCALARRIARATAEGNAEYGPVLEVALDIINQIGIILEQLSREGRWANTLLARPAGVANRVFDLHYHTAGYPAWDVLATQLQSGLVAQIAKEASKPPRERDHNILTYCTAPQALIPILRRDALLSALAWQDEDNAPLRAALWQAAARLQGVSDATRRDYVFKFMDVVQRGAAKRTPTSGRSGFGRRRYHLFALAELDPEADPTHIPDINVWQEAARQAACDEDNPLLEMAPAEDEEPEEEKVGEETAKRGPRLWYYGNRITLDRNPGPDQVNVFQVREMAEAYAAVLGSEPALVRTSGTQNLIERLNRAARFLMSDLLFHTGRLPDWIAAIHLGPLPSPGEILEMPVYPYNDGGYGAICYVPRCRVGIPPRFFSADEQATDERARCAEACELVQIWHYLPLTPRQVNLIQGYRKIRDMAFHNLPMGMDVEISHDTGPLILVAHDGQLHPWTEADTQVLCRDLTTALRRWHPDYPNIQPGRFRSSFTAWYRYYGLDPVYALWVSEHYRNELQMPAIYSRVRVEALARAYATAQENLMTEIVTDYKNLVNSTTLGKRDPLLWQPQITPRLEPWHDESFGSWHCPRLSSLRALFAGLSDMVASSDPDIAARGRTARLAAGLTAMIGLRPAEVCNLRAHWVDLDNGTIATHGKDNFALTSDRQVAIPKILRPLLQNALANNLNGPLPEVGHGHYMLWLMSGETPTPLTVAEGNHILVEAGQRAGLRENQVPGLVRAATLLSELRSGNRCALWHRQRFDGPPGAGL